MDKLSFRARQVHPTVVVGVEPNGEEALGLILVAIDIVTLTCTVSKRNENCRNTNANISFTITACCV